MDENISLNICRVCMSTNVENLEFLFAPYGKGFVADILADCISVEITEDDKMPQHICRECLKELISVSTFIKKAKTSDQILRKLNCTVAVPLDNLNKNEFDPLDDDKMDISDPCELLEIVKTNYESDEHDFDPDISDDDPDFEAAEQNQNDDDERIERPISKRCKKSKSKKEIVNAMQYLTKIKINGFYCCRPKCFELFTNEKDVEEHVKIKHPNAYYRGPVFRGKPVEKCTVCHSTFTDLKVFKAHLDCRKNEEFLLECNFCKTKFWKGRVESAKSHIRHHLSNKDEGKIDDVVEEPKPYSQIGKQFGIKENFTEIEITGIYCCRPKCYKIFTSQKELTTHVKESHTESTLKKVDPNKSVGKCEACQINFTSQDVKKAHNNMRKNEKYLLECNLCKVRFWRGRYDSARKHMQLMHFNKTEMEVIVNQSISIGPDFDPLPYLQEVEVIEPYCCQNRCLQTFSSDEELLQHIKNSHEYSYFREFDQTEFVGQCKFCYTLFKSPELFKSHIELRANEKIFLECKICTVKFWKGRLSSAKTHVRGHFKVKTETRDKLPHTKYDFDEFRQRFGWLCCSQGCWTSFETEQALLDHAKANHTEYNLKRDEAYKDRKPFMCPICCKRFEEENLMIRHRKRKYLLQNVSFACEICGLVVRKQDMQIHRLKHNQKKDFICDICQSSFYTKGKLKAHLSTHNDDRPFVCPTCKYAFKKKGYLKTHLKIHQPNSHTFECNLCPAKFRDKFKLKQHQRTHTGEKPFNCRYCELAFADDSNRKVHEMSHTGDYPYNCNVCNRGFSRKSFYLQHKH